MMVPGLPGGLLVQQTKPATPYQPGDSRSVW